MPMRIHTPVRGMLSAAAAAFLLLSAWSADAREDLGVVFGEMVPVRPQPNAQSNTLVVLETGDLVKVCGRTDRRDRGGEHDHGYYWYQVELFSGDTGWVYGTFLYLIGCEGLSGNNAAFYQPTGTDEAVLQFPDGKTCRFAVAVEPSCPPIDQGGLTGSSVHGLPVLYCEDELRVFPLFVPNRDSLGILFRWEWPKQYWYRLVNDFGLVEKVVGLEVIDHEKPVLMITVEYTTQEGGGLYTVIAEMDGGYLEVIEYGHVSGTPY